LCIDLDWVFRGGQNPVAILREAGMRTASLHIRSSRNRVWSEAIGAGDIDYAAVAVELKRLRVQPFLVAELAYEAGTKPTRSLEENLRLSREYVEQTLVRALAR
jgi:hypothetical protein